LGRFQYILKYQNRIFQLHQEIMETKELGSNRVHLTMMVIRTHNVSGDRH
jgi:hypothetical protein